MRLAREEQTDGEQKAEDVPVGIQAVEPMVEGVDEKAVLMTEEENIAHSTPKIDKKMLEPAMPAANVQPVPVAPPEPKVDAPPVAKGPDPEGKPKKKKKGFFSKLFGR